MSEILLVSGNPRGRRKDKHRRHGGFRRNPSMRSVTGRIMPTVTAGLVGGVGGVANDALFGFVSGMSFFPAVLKTGIARHAVKLLSAIAVGGLGGMVLKGKGVALANGAASVAVRDALREQLSTAFPSLPLGDYDGLLGYDDPAQQVGEYMQQPAGVGEYMPQ